ncbi:hypothetical protein [Caenispirillum bisanense]|uniref:tetratricopeptide repeat protein n=1 Tax=Caenispirillum bisanense TaxID=414052 RepID=UPI0031CFCFFC
MIANIVRRLPLSRSLVAAAALLALPGAAAAQQVTEAQMYRDCMRLAAEQPKEAWEKAGQWIGLAGGEPARHCAAVALIGLEEYREAAERLEMLAVTSTRAEAVRAGMLAQAAQAWLLDGNTERAYAAQTTALELLPEDPSLLIDRAVTLGTAKNFNDAVADLSRALTAAPDREDALVYRATAYRYLDQLDLARADVDRALSLDPTSPGALLEKGILARLAGDDAGAREAWKTLLATAAPESPEAELARDNIARLELGN